MVPCRGLKNRPAEGSDKVSAIGRLTSAGRLPTCPTKLLMTPLDFPHGAVAFGSAFLAGAINSVAGGGTLVSFPPLIWLGLPSVTANPTSTVSTWPSSVIILFG